MTFKYFDPKTGKKVWKSKNVSKFEVLSDRRSCKSELFNVTFKDLPDGSQEYAVQANLDADVQLMYTFRRPADAKGWKLGKGPRGGYSYFGSDLQAPAGYVMHRFWPYTKTQGLIVLDGNAIDAEGQGIFVQAVQGMRPNLVAKSWNFCTFQSTELGGTAATLMEFTTTNDYGTASGAEGASGERQPQVVTFGSVTCNGKLVAVVAATRSAAQLDDTPSAHSETRIVHGHRTLDESTGYEVPQEIKYTWDGPGLTAADGGVRAEPGTRVNASLQLSLGEPSATKGLVDKVDVLAEIPYVVRKMVNYVAGTKPYIYQTLNPAKLTLSVPTSLLKEIDAKSSESAEPVTQLTLDGTVFEEHTFISV